MLPKTVRARALALLRRLTDGGYISWRPDALELIVDRIEHKGTNLVDLAGHVVQQHCAKPLVHGSPGPPPGFAKFAAALRRANASCELVRNRRPWPQIYIASNDEDNNDDDGGDDTEVEDVRSKSEPLEVEEKELWEEEAIESSRNEPSAMTEDDRDQEEDYVTSSQGEAGSEPICSLGVEQLGITASCPLPPGRRVIRRSSPPCLTFVSTIAERVRLLAWRESPSYGWPWAGGLLEGPLESPGSRGKLHAAPAGALPLPPMADHRVWPGGTATVRPGGLQRVQRGQRWHQVSLLLHRCVFSVRLGTTSDQQVRHWNGGCQADQSRTTCRTDRHWLCRVTRALKCVQRPSSNCSSLETYTSSPARMMTSNVPWWSASKGRCRAWFIATWQPTGPGVCMDVLQALLSTYNSTITVPLAWHRAPWTGPLLSKYGNACTRGDVHDPW